jgi:hypothetical protein
MHLAPGGAYELESKDNNNNDEMVNNQGSSEARPLLEHGDDPRETIQKPQDGSHDRPTTTTTKERALAYGCFLILGVS